MSPLGNKKRERSALRRCSRGERYAKPSPQNELIFPLTINGLDHKTTDSADLSEQLAGA
jgi:hypothetical protein